MGEKDKVILTYPVLWSSQRLGWAGLQFMVEQPPHCATRCPGPVAENHALRSCLPLFPLNQLQTQSLCKDLEHSLCEELSQLRTSPQHKDLSQGLCIKVFQECECSKGASVEGNWLSEEMALLAGLLHSGCDRSLGIWPQAAAACERQKRACLCGTMASFVMAPSRFWFQQHLMV